MNEQSPAHVMNALIARFKALPIDGLNEADTRLQFINKILEKVLGWPVESFHAEEYVDAGGTGDDEKKREWLDYHLRVGETLRLVVEAKRTGKTFSLPATR